MTLQELSTIAGLGGALCAIITFLVWIKFSLNRIEQILLNGGNGLIRRTENLEKSDAARAVLCLEHSRRLQQLESHE